MSRQAAYEDGHGRPSIFNCGRSVIFRCNRPCTMPATAGRLSSTWVHRSTTIAGGGQLDGGHVHARPLPRPAVRLPPRASRPKFPPPPAVTLPLRLSVVPSATGLPSSAVGGRARSLPRAAGRVRSPSWPSVHLPSRAVAHNSRRGRPSVFYHGRPRAIPAAAGRPSSAAAGRVRSPSWLAILLPPRPVA